MEGCSGKGTQARGKGFGRCWHRVDTSPFSLHLAPSSAGSQRCLGNVEMPCGRWGNKGGEPAGAGAKHKCTQTPHHTSLEP